MSWYQTWRPYVSVAERKRKAARHVAQIQKKSGRAATPVQAIGRDPAKSFWGKAWCRHIENLSDFENRLPRGRTYLRNGSVVDLQILPGEVQALVSGSEIYTLKIQIEKLAKARWTRLKTACGSSVASLLDLLQGKFDDAVMRQLTDPREGLFPRTREFKLHCSCPDSAYLCKHLAAVLYGIGTRLDSAPELLFTLRGVDHLELIDTAMASETLSQTLQGESNGLAGSDLGELFGIELESSPVARAPAAAGLPTRGQKQAPRAATVKSRSRPKVVEPARPSRKSTRVKTRTNSKKESAKSRAPAKARRRRKTPAE